MPLVAPDALSVEAWAEAWRQLGASDAPRVRELHAEVVGRYGEPDRHYHTLEHLQECFAVAAEAPERAEHPAELTLALWFHDAIYDTRRKDNEERSASWLVSEAERMGVAADVRARLYDLVMATTHLAHAATADARLLVDIDLAILGAARPRFEAYELQVRREYEWVPEPFFRKARADVLRQFLSRPELYSSTTFKHRFEAPARENLQWSLAQLA